MPAHPSAKQRTAMECYGGRQQSVLIYKMISAIWTLHSLQKLRMLPQFGLFGCCIRLSLPSSTQHLLLLSPVWQPLILS